MEEEKQDLKEEVQERQMEMFLLTDFEVVKKLIKCTSFPSKTYIYQMPNKASSYGDGNVETASNLMNTLLAYQRDEDWRVDQCSHSCDWSYPKGKDDKESIKMVVVSSKNNKEYTILLDDIKQAIVIPDLHSVTIIPGDNVGGDILPNMIIRFTGLVYHAFFKCILVGEDDKENKGNRVLSMKMEPLS